MNRESETECIRDHLYLVDTLECVTEHYMRCYLGNIRKGKKGKKGTNSFCGIFENEPSFCSRKEASRHLKDMKETTLNPCTLLPHLSPQLRLHACVFSLTIIHSQRQT